jgi:hypothetical protein
MTMPASATQEAIRDRAPKVAVALDHSRDAPVDDVVLPRQHFLREMQREQRRAYRSKAPLSAVIFTPGGNNGDATPRVESLLGVLRDSKRETDTLGDLGDQAIAMLLPDTNPQGLQQFVARVAAQVGELQFSLAMGTYPNDLFDDLFSAADKPEVADRSSSTSRASRMRSRCW